ncbi:hypothetical protein [Campylobacter troglodytis]|uniref:hypothetical protein n=1 Tax=Campylobacter troglodytis TaxID=654363 RepID=UPI00115C06E8|nr:hypothetical protein [Campylobacter troglodytis]TQR48144.1 hypothetical protein DMC01_13160 [Campylobacter troglodytis]
MCDFYNVCNHTIRKAQNGNFVVWNVICFVPFCLAIYDDIRDRNRFTDESAIWVCGYIFSISLLWTLPILLLFLALSWGKSYFNKKFVDKENKQGKISLLLL